jgi:DNA-binding transcriptional LysR family regulator
MELYQVRAFVTVARLGHVTKAADALCVTQPAVTAQIKALEGSLGVALFDRGPGKLSLTRAGDQLLPLAEAVLSAGHELMGQARRMQGELRGRVEIGMPGESGDFLRVAALAAGIQRDLPLVELGMRSGAAGHLLDQVRGGALTAALSVSLHPPRDLQWQALRSVCYRVALPLSQAPVMQRGGWRTLAGLPWVDGASESHLHELLRAMFEQQGLTPNVVMRSEDTSDLSGLVRNGTACALLREEVALPGVERGEWLVWGHARVDAQLYFSTSADRQGDPLVVALSAVLRQVWR